MSKQEYIELTDSEVIVLYRFAWPHRSPASDAFEIAVRNNNRTVKDFPLTPADRKAGKGEMQSLYDDVMSMLKEEDGYWVDHAMLESIMSKIQALYPHPDQRSSYPILDWLKTLEETDPRRIMVDTALLIKNELLRSQYLK